MRLLDPITAYRAWAPVYDQSPNPLLVLEERVLRRRLTFQPGQRIVDLGTGTGRWLRRAIRCHGHAVGMDRSAEMLTIAARDHSLHGRVAVADLTALPFASHCADLALCSFALSYTRDPHAVLREAARIAEVVVVSDMHPVAQAKGWSRSFRVGQDTFQIQTFHHSKEAVLRAARSEGLNLLWQQEPHFTQRDRAYFAAAGREDLFEQACSVPAVWIGAWWRT